MAYPGLTGRRLWRELRERGYRGGYTAVTDQAAAAPPGGAHPLKSPHQRANSPIPAFRHSPRSHHPPLKAKRAGNDCQHASIGIRTLNFQAISLPTPAWDRGIRDRHGLAVAGQRVTPSQDSCDDAAMYGARTCRSRPRSDRGCRHPRWDQVQHNSCIAGSLVGQDREIDNARLAVGVWWTDDSTTMYAGVSPGGVVDNSTKSSKPRLNGTDRERERG